MTILFWMIIIVLGLIVGVKVFFGLVQVLWNLLTSISGLIVAFIIFGIVIFVISLL